MGERSVWQTDRKQQALCAPRFNSTVYYLLGIPPGHMVAATGNSGLSAIYCSKRTITRDPIADLSFSIYWHHYPSRFPIHQLYNYTIGRSFIILLAEKSPIHIPCVCAVGTITRSDARIRYQPRIYRIPSSVSFGSEIYPSCLHVIAFCRTRCSKRTIPIRSFENWSPSIFSPARRHGGSRDLRFCQFRLFHR